MLLTKNDSGLKIEFLNAMATSGHVVCAPEITKGSNLTVGFHEVRTHTEVVNQISKLLRLAFDEKDWQNRINDLKANFGESRLKKIFSLPK